jgi:hypothetical protein
VKIRPTEVGVDDGDPSTASGERERQAGSHDRLADATFTATDGPYGRLSSFAGGGLHLPILIIRVIHV